ncbi:MAG: MMPL family transporter [Mariprofundaceae bacterium]|nr:MMPL family transporter [Mariprofundaceae bacterium]
MFEKIFFVGMRYRVVTLLILLLITVLTSLGLPELRVDTGLASLVSGHDPHKADYDKITAEFGSDLQTVIYLHDAKLWTPERLATLESLHYALKELPFVERLEDVFTLQVIAGKDGAVAAHILLKEAPDSIEAAQKAKQEALYNPLIKGNFVSSDGKSTAIILSIHPDPHDPDFDHHAYVALEQLISAYQPQFDELFQMGAPRLHAELKTILFHDMRFLAPLSASVLMLVVVFFLRSGTAAVLPLITSLLSLIWTFGIMGWWGVPLNILSVMLPSLVIVMGSTESTHMITSYFQGLIRHNHGEDKAQTVASATRYMMLHMAVPTVLTVATTALGFASNILNNIGLIQDFAVASTLAISFNGIITLLFVPLILQTFGPGFDTRHNSQRYRISQMFTHLFQVIKERFYYLFLFAIVLLCAFFIQQASRIHVSNDPMSYLQPSHPLIKDNETIHRHLSGMKIFFITLEATREKAFLDPKYIDRMVEIQSFINSQGVFDRSTSLADYLALTNRELHDGNPEYYVVPRTRDLVAQYLMFFHRTVLEPYVSHDYRRANIIVRHNISDSDTLNRHIEELREAAQNIAGVDVHVLVNGENLMVNAATEDLLWAQIESLLILLLVIALLMSIMFTSLKGGLVALVPNLIPITLMFGMMGLMDISLNPGTVMVAVVAIGIAIDGTIHLFSRYNTLTRKASDYDSAVLHTVREESTPMVVTSLALALGFAILIFSDFTLVAQFGALAAATVLFALFSNLIITPMIMARVRLVSLHQILSLPLNISKLATSPLFQGLSHYEIRKAILIFESVHYHQGDVLMKRGETGCSMFMVLSGEVEVVCHTVGDHPLTNTLSEGSIFGEIGYTRELPRTVNARALKDVEVLIFNYRRMKRDLQFFPQIVAKLNFNISRILGERLADVVQRMKGCGKPPSD